MPTPLNQSIDFERLLNRLAERACDILAVSRFMASDYVIDGLGKSPIDFSADTLVLYLKGSLPFTGDAEAMYHYLAEVMGNDILDALRSSPRKTTKKVPPISGTLDDNGAPVQGLDDFDSGFSVDELVQGDIFKDRLYALLEESEPELYELVYAVFEENARTPRAIAEVIGTTAADVQNRKKRLKTFLATHNLKPGHRIPERLI